MPKRKNYRKRNTETESEANANVTCGLCCKTVVEDRDKALLCEGTCDRWLHCYCAGITETQYEALQDSPMPFLCSMCSQFKQAAVIKDVQEKIDSFIAEVTELRCNLSDLELQVVSLKNINEETPKAGATGSSMWTEVVRHGKSRTVTDTAPGSQSKQQPASRHLNKEKARRPWQSLNVMDLCKVSVYQVRGGYGGHLSPLQQEL